MSEEHHVSEAANAVLAVPIAVGAGSGGPTVWTPERTTMSSTLRFLAANSASARQKLEPARLGSQAEDLPPRWIVAGHTPPLSTRALTPNHGVVVVLAMLDLLQASSLGSMVAQSCTQTPPSFAPTTLTGSPASSRCRLVEHDGGAPACRCRAPSG
jgi:hypothetical protein